MVAHIVPQGAELPFPALVKGYLVGIGLILLLQYTGAVLRVIAASHLPVEMEYQEVEKNEHPIHKQGQPGRAVGKVKQTQAELLFVTSLEELKIETDDSRLQQVLINLLINATKFTAEGAITLKLEKESDDMALFSVTDTGCGIPKEKQAHIFQRFEKLDENAQGSGLGLSICQLIIEHIGGRIWIDPDYDEGSRFLFTHPIRQTKGTQKKEGRA